MKTFNFSFCALLHLTFAGLFLFSACGPEVSAAAGESSRDSKETHKTCDGHKRDLEAALKQIESLKVDNANLQQAASSLRDPTWNELKAFLETTRLEETKYDVDNFNCMHFSIWLRDKARDRRFRAAFVNFYYEGRSVGHAINAFETLDFGKVYVEPQGNRIAYLKKGEIFGTIPLKYVKRKYHSCPSNTDDFKSPLSEETYAGNIFDYDYFSNFQSRMNCYFKSIDSYNAAVADYNANSFSRHTHKELDTWKKNLDLLEQDLGREFSTEKGIVTKSKSLWN